MNPWWLRPPSDESEQNSPAGDSGKDSETGGDSTASSPASEGTVAETVRSSSSRAGSRRRRRATAAAGPVRKGGESRPSRDSQIRPAVSQQLDQGGRVSAPAGSDAVVTTGDLEAEPNIVVLCDVESLALGIREIEGVKLNVHNVLQRLLDKGKIVVKRAYADWERFSDLRRGFHEAGFEIIDIPQKRHSGKSSVHIRLTVDAMELCCTKHHLKFFAILSADADLAPLVSKLREHDRTVIGVGTESVAAAALVEGCDEFIFYDEVWQERIEAPNLENLDDSRRQAFGLLVESVRALMRENKDVLWGSMIKQAIQRRHPAFSEGSFGYATFSELLEDAQKQGVVTLRRDERSGGYVVCGFSRDR